MGADENIEKNSGGLAPSLCFRTRKEFLAHQIDWIDELKKADNEAENDQEINMMPVDVQRDIRH